MFHRANQGRASVGDFVSQNEAQVVRQEPVQHNGIGQTAAVRKHARPVDQAEMEFSANQNNAVPYTAQHRNVNYRKQVIKAKEARPMNNQDAQAKNQSPISQPSQAPQARVDIPGSNFQRPGAPARPAYPGAYPGAAQPANQASGGMSSYSSSLNNQSNMGRRLIIGEGITLSGEIESCEHLRVEGTVEATLKGASLLDISESGAFYGTVEIEEANIAGRFEGDITAKGRLTIESTGVVIGNISYKELAVEAGATLEGSISPMGSQGQHSQAKRGSAPSKSKKVSQGQDSELPFADKSSAM